MSVRTPCSPVDAESLREQVSGIVMEYLAACQVAEADLGRVEDALDTAMKKLQQLLGQAGVDEAMAQVIHWKCPECRQDLGYHDTQHKYVVMRQGVVRLERGRYRCGSCGKGFQPVDVLNDLQETGFTLGARERVAEQAAKEAFEPASESVGPQLQVSAKSVDRIVKGVAGWRQAEEEEAVKVALGEREQGGPMPTGQAARLSSTWSPAVLPKGSVLTMAIDAGKIRGNWKDEKGQQAWFDGKAASISVTLGGDELPRRQAGGKFFLARVLPVERFFEVFAAAYEQLSPALKKLRQVFLGDGGPWWERAAEYFPDAQQVLDIYHVAENVGGAAVLCFGEGSTQAKWWRQNARDWLKEEGKPDEAGKPDKQGNLPKKRRVAELVGILFRARPSQVKDKDAHHKVRLAIRYLTEHWRAGRMNYWEFQEAGLPIGSGTAESAVKQTMIQRERQAGMMWTREGADAVLSVRGALLSGELGMVVERKRQACREEARTLFLEPLPAAV